MSNGAMLFQTTKIQIFESNSQPTLSAGRSPNRLFQTTKIQIFESNSQLFWLCGCYLFGCFRLQRYKFLKAIHNMGVRTATAVALFQTTKIQIFESNSQQVTPDNIAEIGCFRLQRYKILITIYLSL